MEGEDATMTTAPVLEQPPSPSCLQRWNVLISRWLDLTSYLLIILLLVLVLALPFFSATLYGFPPPSPSEPISLTLRPFSLCEGGQCGLPASSTVARCMSSALFDAFRALVVVTLALAVPAVIALALYRFAVQCHTWRMYRASLALALLCSASGMCAAALSWALRATVRDYAADNEDAPWEWAFGAGYALMQCVFLCAFIGPCVATAHLAEWRRAQKSVSRVLGVVVVPVEMEEAAPAHQQREGEVIAAAA